MSRARFNPRQESPARRELADYRLVLLRYEADPEGNAALAERLAHTRARIDCLANEQSKTVLTLRYILGLPWTEVRKRMFYERTQIFKIHKQALEEIDHETDL